MRPGIEPGRVSFEHLSEAKRELLSSLLLARGKDRAVTRTIRRRDPSRPCPLSHAQEQLWVTESLADGQPLYNVPYGVRLRGGLDVTALRAALAGILVRHTILRTIYRQRSDGGLEQIVRPAPPVVLPVEDVTSEESAFAAARREAETPIDLRSGPVIRGRLLRIANDDHLLVLVVHHIATDAWSAGVLFEELAELYDAARTSRTPAVPELDIDYADVAADQRARQPDDYDRLIARWRDQLRGTQRLALPAVADRARAGSRVHRVWNGRLGRDLHRLAHSHRSTVFNVMLAAFAVVLYRYTGTSRFVIGTVMANRDRQTERLIGYFANTVPLVAEVGPSDRLAEVLTRITECSLWAREHEIPFDVLVNGLSPRRTLAESPLFDVMFVFNNGHEREVGLRGLSFTPTPVHSGTAKFPLDLSCAVTEEGVTVSLEFDHSVLETDGAERLLDHYQRVLDRMCELSDQLVDDVDLLTPAERELAVREWNRTEREYPVDATAHGLFEEWVDLRPDAVAVVCGAESISYGELDLRANQLAHALLARGCGRGERVGVCLDRGIDLVVAQLAIAKAGAGYVPLDPGYPGERLRWMLADSGARLVVNHDHGLAGDSVEAIGVDAGSPYPTTRPKVRVLPSDLLYLIYTSGSTGLPKGVLLDHRGRVNNFHDFNRRFDIGPGDRVFGVSALAFDMSAYDVFGTLMAGASVVFPETGDERSPDRWIETIQRERVTVWHSVPALFGLLVEEAETQGTTCLPIRLVLLGGDWIPLSLPQRATARLRDSALLVSLGGATEVSMDSTIQVIERVETAWRSIPYGGPMANQTAYVLDSSLTPQPVGVAGELYLGGVGVGWGYHNRPRLTAERFVPDPFSTAPGARFYRTGDRVRRTSDGGLELLGRIDFQVKINGYRVETGEIEVALRDLLDGGSCLVMAHGARAEAKTLVAYIVVPPGVDSAGDDELKQALATRLPDHMVPSAFVRLASFPLTYNGKVDRSALPAPTVARQKGRGATTRTERRLVALWRDVLSADDVPVDANFFALGGNSIAVIRLAGAARRAGLAITPRMVFAHQTIESLARLLDEDVNPATALDSAVTRGPVLAANPTQRHMLDTLERAWVPGLYQMQSTLCLPFDVDPDCFVAAWQQLTRRHPILRSAFRRGGDGSWTRVVVDEVTPAITLLDWSERDALTTADELIELLERERSERVDVAVPPLWRVWLVRGPTSWWMGQIQNYLLADGWSNLVLLDELLMLYLAAVNGQQAELAPAPEIGTPDVDANRETDATYWRRQLVGARSCRLAAAPGRLGPSQFRRLTARLERSLGTKVRARAVEHGHTLSTVVCAGWALLVAARLNRTDVTVGVVSAGRDHTVDGVERAVGLFITALPVRIAVSWDEQLTAVFDRFQLARAEGAEHASIETGELQRMGVDTDPLFDSVVVVANYPVTPALRAWQPGDAAETGSSGTRNQTEFSLRLDVVEDDEPRIALSYYRDRLDDASARRLLDDYVALLGAVAETRTTTPAHLLPFLHTTTGEHP